MADSRELYAKLMVMSDSGTSRSDLQVTEPYKSNASGTFSLLNCKFNKYYQGNDIITQKLNISISISISKDKGFKNKSISIFEWACLKNNMEHAC